MSLAKVNSNALRAVAIPTLAFSALVVLGLLRPKLWISEEVIVLTSEEIWARRVYLAVLWLGGMVFVHRWMSWLILDTAASRALGKPMPKIFRDLLAVALLGIAAVGILTTVFGVSTTGFWATSSVIGIVLGIALRPIILDFCSGLGANLEQAYRLGDWITIPGPGESVRGWIEEINWRTLRLRTRDGCIVIVPNSRLATSSVINHSFPTPESRFQVRVRLDIEVPVERALRILSSAAQAACRMSQGPCLQPPPDVLVTDASGEGVEYAVRFWLDPAQVSSDTVTHQVWSCIIEHLTKAGLNFARPQENVYVARLPRAASGFKSIDDRLAFLRKVGIFQSFPDSSLRILAAELQVSSARPGQGLVREGDPGESMFLLAEGMLRVVGTTPGSGTPLELATLQPGEVFGERSLLTGEPRSASVVAVTETVVLEITREALQHLLDREPELLRLMEETVSQRDQANHRLADGAVCEAGSGIPASRTQAFIIRMRQLFGR